MLMLLLSSPDRISAESHVIYVIKEAEQGNLCKMLSFVLWRGSYILDCPGAGMAPVGGSVLVVAPGEAPHELGAVEQCQEPAVAEEAVLWSQF